MLSIYYAILSLQNLCLSSSLYKGLCNFIKFFIIKQRFNLNIAQKKNCYFRKVIKRLIKSEMMISIVVP